MAVRGGKNQDTRPGILKPGESIAQSLGTTLNQISRWRKKLDDPASFENVFEEACAKYSKILEFETTAHVGQNTGETEWFTPAEFIEPARRVLGAIDLDPASTPEANAVIKATKYYTRKDDGLSQPWSGRVWMNPPYAYPLVEEFSRKLAASFTDSAVSAAIALINNATETAWFRAMADVASAICCPQGRIQFWHPKKGRAAPLQGQALLYMGADVTAFHREFSCLGIVWVKP